MNTLKKPKALIQATLMVAVLVMGGFTLHAADPATPPTTNSVTPPAASTVPIKPRLTGAELYSMHCNRCHPERYPTERTAAQWKTIMLHMQVRANIPGNQARLILGYLQENSGR